jgi:hypothetical protein
LPVDLRADPLDQPLGRGPVVRSAKFGMHGAAAATSSCARSSTKPSNIAIGRPDNELRGRGSSASLTGTAGAMSVGPVAEDGDDAAAEDWTRARSTAHPRNRKFAAVRDTPAAAAWIRGDLARGATRQAGRWARHFYMTAAHAPGDHRPLPRCTRQLMRVPQPAATSVLSEARLCRDW